MSHPRTTTVVARRFIKAPPHAVFAAVTDVSTYRTLGLVRGADITSDLPESGNLTGATRRIDLYALGFNEQLFQWSPPGQMRYRITRSWPLRIVDQHGSITCVQTTAGVQVEWRSTYRLAVPLVGGLLTLLARAPTRLAFAHVLRTADRLARTQPASTTSS